MIVCEYISNPLLINNLKFDLRIYVAVTGVNPLRIYIYEEGLTRLATEAFNLEGKNFDRFAHLTNFSVNKKSDKFYIDAEKDGVGNKWSLKALKQYFESVNINYESIRTDIEDIVVKTILSIEHKLFTAAETYLPYRNNCFELLGFDILIDDKLKSWLLEVNLSPSLACESPLDLKIKSELIVDLFNMVGIFPSKKKSSMIMKCNENFLIYKNHQNFSSKAYDSNLEVDVLTETYEEIKRSGKFKLIYPSYNAIYYRQFFEEPRKTNEMLYSTIAKNFERLQLNL